MYDQLVPNTRKEQSIGSLLVFIAATIWVLANANLPSMAFLLAGTIACVVTACQQGNALGAQLNAAVATNNIVEEVQRQTSEVQGVLVMQVLLFSCLSIIGICLDFYMVIH